jgi:hypothetical protein
MSDDIFDFKELDKYERKLLELASNKMPRETMKFIRKEGTQLRKVTVKNARAKVKKKTGNYFKSIKKGRAYIYQGNGGTSIRVYASTRIAPHAHLIEKGHRYIDKDGKENLKKGYHVFENSEKEFEGQFYNDIENFIDDVIGKGLS